MGACDLEGKGAIEDQIEELSSGTSLAGKFARTVVIDYCGGFGPDDSRLEETALMKRLKQAIVSFKNVEKVMYVVSIKFIVNLSF